ncbi:MAG: hypothetical protein JNJ54_32090 [Myxococcaceae bacterium]|nr:hypothetical protein [Myxococcaceae bacterium]
MMRLVAGPFLLLVACQHPAAVALERGDLATACLETRLGGANPVVTDVNRQLLDGRLSLMVRPFSPEEVAALVPDAGHLELPIARVRWALKDDSGPPVEVSWTELSIGGVNSALTPERHSLVELLPAPPRPELEWVPTEYLPKKYVEEAAPGRWEVRPVYRTGDTILFMMTGGLSAFLKELDTELVERPPETAAQKQARERRNKAVQARFEKAEEERLAKSREVIGGVVARNQARVAWWEAQKAARERLGQALDARARTDCTSGPGSSLIVRPGGHCEYLVPVKLWGTPDFERKAALAGRADAVVGQDCTRHTRWTVPLGEGEARGWRAVLDARFTKGPVFFALDGSRSYDLRLVPLP